MSATKRLNVNLPTESYEQLKSLADQTNRSITEVVRTALGLVKIAMEEEKNNRSLAIAENDRVVKQIVLPH